MVCIEEPTASAIVSLSSRGTNLKALGHCGLGLALQKPRHSKAAHLLQNAMVKTPGIAVGGHVHVLLIGTDVPKLRKGEYHALTRLAAEHIIPQLQWSERFRHSHHFDNGLGTNLLRPNQPGWATFTRETIATLEKDYTHVVFTDISGFYENIDLQHLSQDLRYVGVPTDVADLLSRFLNKWAEPRHKGIPQGNSASDVLAEFYLDPVDKALTDEGVVLHRYSDDMRLFARSEPEARRSLHRLTRLLRDRGLNLQTAKSEIHSNADARDALLRLNKRVENQHKSVAEELRMLGDMGYEVAEDLERTESATTERPTPEALLGIFESIQTREIPYDKSLIRYLLARLSNNALFEASGYAINVILTDHPEETNIAIRYLRSFPKELSLGLIDKIVDHLVSPNCIYDYQVYQIVRWFCEELITNDRLATNLRSRQMPPWLRQWAITYRAMAARNKPNTNEYASLMREYASADKAERATILVSLHFAPADFRKSNWARQSSCGPSSQLPRFAGLQGCGGPTGFVVKGAVDVDPRRAGSPGGAQRQRAGRRM